MKFQDNTPLTGITKTSEGYILADAKAARTGIQKYAGFEVGRPDLQVVSVYRPADSVFSKDSLETFPNIPLTLGHPQTPVTAETYDAENVGNVFEVTRDGESIRASMAVMSKRAIDAMNDGIRELSVGYDAELEWTDGVTQDGEAYQAIQKNIRANHLAIVKTARAGSEYRIGDSADNKWGIAPLTLDEKKEKLEMADTLKTVVLGDAAVQVAIADSNALEKFKADTALALSDAMQKAKKDLDEKDKELATKDAEIADLKKQVLDDAALDKRVNQRAKLIADANSIDKAIKTEGVSDADIRKAVVLSVRGEDAVKDKAEAYIDAAFDLAIADAAKTQDPLAKVLSDVSANDSANPWNDSVFNAAGVALKKEV